MVGISIKPCVSPIIRKLHIGKLYFDFAMFGRAFRDPQRVKSLKSRFTFVELCACAHFSSSSICQLKLLIEVLSVMSFQIVHKLILAEKTFSLAVFSLQLATANCKSKHPLSLDCN